MSDSPEISTQKQTLRSAAIARRNAIPAAERIERRQVICAELLTLVEERFAHLAQSSERSDSTRLCAAYSALGSEVVLNEFISAAYERGWDVAFPVMVKDKTRDTMIFVKVDAQAWHSNSVSFLIRPACSLDSSDSLLESFARIEASSIDVAVIPMTACDPDNNRMGYGGGNYDRFLPLLRDDCLVAGVAFNEQEVPLGSLPLGSHDLALPHIIRG